MSSEWGGLPGRVVTPAFWYLRKYWFALDAWKIFVGMLLLFAALVWWVVILGLQRDIATLTLIQPVDTRSAPSVAVSPTDNLAAFLAFLPVEDERLRYIDDFHRLATETGVQLLQADYQAGKNTKLPVSELGARLVLSGQTLAVRHYVDRLLVDMPNLAIENLAYELLAGASAEQARLTLDTRLYLRPVVHHE